MIHDQQPGIPDLFAERVDMGVGPTGEPRTPLAWKRARNTSKAQITALRDSGTLTEREQLVMDSIAGYWNAHNSWPTAAELARWMFRAGKLEREDFNLVRPRCTTLSVGERRFNKEMQQYELRGGGHLVTLPARLCTITHRRAHPYKLP